jgi:hypothetical protein
MPMMWGFWGLAYTRVSAIWISVLNMQAGKIKMDIEYILKLIANNGFPLVLSIYLVMKLEYFINELVKNQKEFSRNVTSEIKDINHSITDLRIFIASSDRKP